MIRFPPRKLLVATDMSDPSLSAIEAAKFFSLRLKASLELIYVHDTFNEFYVFGSETRADLAPNMMKQIKDFRRWREEKLRKLAGGMPSKRVKVRSLAGSPAAILADLARKKSADMIVMGTHGYSGADRIFFGSVTETVLRESQVPVLAVHRRKTPFRISRILAPYNMTPYAGRALAYSIGLARILGIRINVIYVSSKGEDSDKTLGNLDGSLRALLGRKEADDLNTIVLQGDPRRVILEQAEKGGYDLIALSAHRKRLVSDFVLGSTVERVLRHSSIPILAVPSVEAGSSKSLEEKL